MRRVLSASRVPSMRASMSFQAHGEHLSFGVRGLSRLTNGVGQLPGRVGVGPVAEDEVEEEHAARPVGSLGGDPLHPQGGVDHRVRAAAGQLVGAEVDDGVP